MFGTGIIFGSTAGGAGNACGGDSTGCVFDIVGGGDGGGGGAMEVESFLGSWRGGGGRIVPT
jgi:hypothetical protein